MFTGMITEVGEVARTAGGGRIKVKAPKTAGALEVGGSVALEGVCLTAVDVGEGYFEADISRETAATTTIGSARPGDAVNLELPTAVGAPLGGHLVQGHVDGFGTVKELARTGEGYTLRVAVPPDLSRYVVEKGSVAVAGISLTAVDVADDGFGAAIIPHTYERTTLKYRRPGDKVNVEVDLIAKYVERFVGGRRGGLTRERLAELGYGG
ncbi:MAG: riboflavin synthase [candidate division Zixibacteria bacterium]|nr:riboflavin synthase [candidate division Zixibacteria bacterium]